MADDGHTINVGPVTVGPLTFVAEVDRLRAENVALAAALADIAGIYEVDGCWTKPIAECSQFNGRLCHEDYPDDPDEWCPVCVAEVAWCAWKMGALR